MSDLLKVKDDYENSPFFLKYKNTYFSDVILKDVFQCDVKLHRLYGLNKKSYEEIHHMSTEVMKDLLIDFADATQFKDEALFWKMLYAIYIDPDSNGMKVYDGITCTADGLFSIRRIYRKHGMKITTIHEYAQYRRVPIFFFTMEKNGINTTRASVFGDRIDYTLYDMKKYFAAKDEEEKEKCKLISAYRMPKTKAWLDAMGSFERLIDWYGVKNIFTNGNYEVCDIEQGKDVVIRDYLDGYKWEWSDRYYKNLQNCVNQFMNR